VPKHDNIRKRAVSKFKRETVVFNVTFFRMPMGMKFLESAS